MTLLETEGTAYLDSENGTYWAHKESNGKWFINLPGVDKYISEDNLTIEQQELIFLSDKWESAIDRLMGIVYQYMTGDFSSKPISKIHALKLKD